MLGTQSDCIAWLVVGTIGLLLITVLNIITVIVFVKQRQLQRRGTYLVIHLAIVDLLVGTVSGPVITSQFFEHYCGLWKVDIKIFPALVEFFPTASIVNLAFISLERAHATFFPFKHRETKKSVYVVLIVAIWFLTSPREILQYVLDQKDGSSNPTRSFTTLSMVIYTLASLFVVCISYIAIFIKVRFCPIPQRHGANNRERRLTATLLIVTLASLLTWLPAVIFRLVRFWDDSAIPSRSLFFIDKTLATLVGVNSMVNPIVYAVRMPEFRASLKKIFCKAPSNTRQTSFPLRNR
ncbi:lysophosphatidic acid receptor 1-A-like [Stylophora pistillata]|uniref:lysophosphatidic acid receptor 1-A-like n=1 Tax=Stylophora pistillata TaxID=50429 RepID=UPI000C05750C|nr:lysophosphatidic acid receptor 1-A-like [Stylophora pistillata]XP_022794741.1 lysophosphatidic acid receptor 1-A-like [Stylophora pistillata]XP_022794742.1 lysophosphatidic acid receptor 1-A-like [Stylophora pistillata]XP_022794743.1 lysophosphatidic acid receptor 1-A-like [Stylophora pistillata]